MITKKRTLDEGFPFSCQASVYVGEGTCGKFGPIFLLDPRNHIIQTKVVPSGVNTILTPTSEHPLAPIWEAECYARFPMHLVVPV